MSKIIGLNINLSKIDKSRIVEGKKGKYLDAVVILKEEQDDFGQNGMIIQSVSKEERDKGVRGEILGNVKILGGKGKISEDSGNSGPELDSNFDDMDDDLPF